MFIFKYVCPYSDTLTQYKANHGIALYITAKKAYTDMKSLIEDVKKQKNLFNLKNDWYDFSKSAVYSEIIRQFEGDLEMIYAQALSYMFDIQIQSKEIEAEGNIEKVVSKNWENLVKDTVSQYWFLLAEAVGSKEPKNEAQRKSKETVIRVLQALDYYNENKTLDIEEFDKIMEVLNIDDAEKKMKAKINYQ